mgnify:FL=1
MLIFGASYGSLFAAKLLLAGHDVQLVCLPAEASLINREGIRVALPVKGSDEIRSLDSGRLLGRPSARPPGEVNPTDFDLVVLAMQEPQYRFDDVRALLASVAAHELPCISIMNMPPPPFLDRIPGIDAESCGPCYADPSVWSALDPQLITHCSADPQASRAAGGPLNSIDVRLPSNFKCGRFENEAHNAMLHGLAASIDSSSLTGGPDRIELPVKLRVHESIFVPLAKWPMLIAGNYRCVTMDGIRSIESAVHSDIEASRSVYEWVRELCRTLGASAEDLVSFEKYAAAAHFLKGPSSAARALASGAAHIERVDKLVQLLALQRRMESPVLNEIVERVDQELSRNRREVSA